MSEGLEFQLFKIVVIAMWHIFYMMPEICQKLWPLW